MVCNKKLNKFINEVDDISRVHRALESVHNEGRNKTLVGNAIRAGYYNTRSPLKSDPKELVGETISVEEIATAQVSQVKVERASHLNEDLISINDGQYVVKSNGFSSDGTKNITMGSSVDRETEGLESVLAISGTMAATLDGLVEELKETDKEVDALPPEHEAHLDNIFNKYKEIMLDASKDIDLDIEVFLDLEDVVKANRGFATPATGRIDLILGEEQHVSSTEVLAEELQHVLISDAFKRNPLLEKQVMDLREVLAKEFDFTVFLDNPRACTQEEVDIAREKYNYAFHNESYPAEEFLAKITTNRHLVKALGTVTDGSNLEWIRPAKPKDGQRLSKGMELWNVLVGVLNSIYWGNKLKGGSARELALSMLDTVIRAEHEHKKDEDKNLYDRSLELIEQGDRRLHEFTRAGREEHQNYADYLSSQDKSMVGKAIESLWKIKSMSRVKSLALQNGWFTNVFRNTDNQDISKVFEMFRHSKEFVDKEAIALKKATADVLDNVYGLGKLDSSKRKALKRVVLDTDLGVLGDSATILSYLKDESKVDQDYNDLTKDFNAKTISAIEDLATLLVTNVAPTKNGYVNATQIALARAGDTSPEAVSKIDKAVSLLALKNSAKLNKDLAISALEENTAGVDHALVLRAKDEAKVIEKAYNGDAMYAVKGAKQEYFSESKKHYLVKEQEMEELVKAGLHNIGKHEELSRIVGEDIYTIVGDSVEAGFSEGLISKTQFTTEGESLKSLLMKFNNLLENEAEAKVKELAKERGKTDGALIPERSGSGKIYDYKVRVPHEVKSKYLSIDDDFVVTVANTVSTLSHKQEAMLSNVAAVEYLNKFYGTYKSNEEFKFIDVSEDSKSELGKEYWEGLPFYIKKQVKENHEGGKLMVEESLLVTTFGYKDVSIVNAPWIKDKVKRQMVAKKIEQVTEEIVSKWKQVIVTLTYGTIEGNNISNMVVALQHTKNKNPLVYLKKYQKYWEMMNQYQEDHKELLKLQVRKEAGDRVSDAQIKGLEAKLESNFVNHIIKDGQYTSMLEDIDREKFDKSGMLEGMLDDLLAKPKNPKTREALKGVVDNIYIRKDARMFNSIMKLTMYGDAINKLILLEDMVQKEGGEVNQAMLNYVDTLHVNYGYLDNRYLKWGNGLFLTFTKYTFRIVPAIANMASRKSLSMFTFESINQLTGLNAATPLEQYYNPIDTLLGKFSLWGDPVDVFRTIFVPPWIK